MHRAAVKKHIDQRINRFVEGSKEYPKANTIDASVGGRDKGPFGEVLHGRDLDDLALVGAEGHPFNVCFRVEASNDPQDLPRSMLQRHNIRLSVTVSIQVECAVLLKHEQRCSVIRWRWGYALPIILLNLLLVPARGRRGEVPGLVQAIHIDSPHDLFIDLVAEHGDLVGFPWAVFDGLGPVVEYKVLCQNQLTHVMAEGGGVIRLLEIRADDAQVQNRLILLGLPGLVLIQQLPGHMLADAVGAVQSRRVVAERGALDNLTPVDYGRVSAGVELHRRDGYEGEVDVGATGPREGLILGNLQGQVHPRLIPLQPGTPRLLVGQIPLITLRADALEVGGFEHIAQIRRVDRLGSQRNGRIEFKH